ncbi:MAG: hypothetical protein JWM42_4042 [Burkholderia sp.]|jgi:hypothetical protein|nr:hypothetical protein [Burkholderia sp.]
MVKGLAKLGNRLHHDRTVKYVDASPCSCAGRLLPNDGRIIRLRPAAVYQLLDATYSRRT